MKGEWAEQRALEYLQSLGHELLRRNYRVRGGEIDLITRDGPALVFTEVKHRSRTHHGHPLEFVTPAKVRLLRRAALRYLHDTLGSDQHPCRFDVIALTGPPGAASLTHVRDAF